MAVGVDSFLPAKPVSGFVSDSGLAVCGLLFCAGSRSNSETNFKDHCVVLVSTAAQKHPKNVQSSNSSADSNQPKLIFEQTIEGLFLKGLGSSVTPDLKARLKAAGLDLDAKLEPAYSMAQWTTFITIAAQLLHSDVDLPKGLHRLGETLLAGFFEGGVGKALSALVRIIGPRQTLMRMKRNLRSGNNYSESEVTEIAPGEYRLWVNEPGVTRYITQGILQAGLAIAGAKGLTVSVEQFDDESVTYLVRWQ